MGSLNRFTASGGDFLRKEEVPQPIVVTIASTGEHCFKEGEASKLTLQFAGGNIKPLACNKTMSQTLAAIFNDTSVRNPAGHVVGGLRLRLPTGQAAPQPAAQFADRYGPWERAWLEEQSRELLRVGDQHLPKIDRSLRGMIDDKDAIDGA